MSSLNPLECIQVAVTHNLLDGSKFCWHPNECLTLKEAVKAYTIGSAYINFLDNESGSIEVGKCADFVILDKNIFEVSVHDIHKAKVLQTYVNGEVVYNSKK